MGSRSSWIRAWSAWRAEAVFSGRERTHGVSGTSGADFRRGVWAGRPSRRERRRRHAMRDPERGAISVRAAIPPADCALLHAHVEASFRMDAVRTLAPSFAESAGDVVSAVLEEASRFASAVLEPLNRAMDARGVSLAEGRVVTAPGHRDAWRSFVENGWPAIDHKSEHGGQQMPLALCMAVQELFDRNCPAFGMLPVPQRSAARLIDAFGDAETKQRWLPGLASGAAGATICISEVGAGSDVLQMRTRATQAEDGSWRIWGEKCWISFGDHDLTDTLVHCVLARTDAPGAKGPEISLFLVEGGGAQHGAVSVLRIEEKLGLHGSPTCTLGFDNAVGHMLGAPGRGLAQMFVMITQMRLAVGAMGLGMASAASDIAHGYAQERRQGGAPGNPVPIAAHRDVQRQLLELRARAELLRGLTLNTANIAEIATRSDDGAERAVVGALLQWLLPIVKTFGAEAAFDNASGAIQVLGGAGYTADWPVEQILRDARVLAVFEGTSGIQALDLVHRRVLRDRSGLDAFLAVARRDGEGTALMPALELLDDAAQRIAQADLNDANGSATPFLALAILTAAGWVAARFLALDPDLPAHAAMRAAAGYWLDRLGPRATLAHAEVLAGAAPLVHFS
ncbi:acyl-CoA dehydrogenase [Sphingomonas sp. HMWF008]|nr:acyl-CoA dehydrogenase [Sphingomonas sp. HMWF008]